MGRLKLPLRHRTALLDPDDSIGRELLLMPEGNELCNIFDVNRDLRELDGKEWPDHFVAFATNGCRLSMRGPVWDFWKSTAPFGSATKTSSK